MDTESLFSSIKAALQAASIHPVGSEAWHNAQRTQSRAMEDLNREIAMSVVAAQNWALWRRLKHEGATRG